jgi:hypothetical protein
MLKSFSALSIFILSCFCSCTITQTGSAFRGVSATPEMDTAGVRRYASGLKARLQADPADSAVARQLRLTEKYLLACAYYEGGGWSWAVKSTGLNATKRFYAAADMLQEIVADPTNPLYYKSLYLRGRIYYWLAKEDSGFFPDTVSSHHFGILSARFPKHLTLQMYRGQQIPFPARLRNQRVKGAPLWAVYQREAIYRMLQLIHWWVKEKQAMNGELGGKYGDDVEILRRWLPAILGADDSVATLGYTRLADGVWNSGLLERGFSKRVDDVEHSAELFRDTHPALFLMKYGDPEYVERCMISMQNFKEVWTGITPRGHRHFKSYYLSATKVLEEEPHGVDVPLNARAVLPGLWLAWYNNNPQLLQSFSEWCHAWIEDAERAENGKPAGVFPAAITYRADKIGGYSGTWYDADLSYPYYKWESLGHIGELYSHLLGMYAITKDQTYLNPLQAVVRILDDARQATTAEYIPGSMEWVKNKLVTTEQGGTGSDHPLSRIFSMARKVTASNAYDHLVMQYGQPYSKYEISRNDSDIYKGFEGLLHALRYNLPLLTSEVKFTDRVYVPGSNLLLGMYTGHFGEGFEYPALVATWKNTGPDVSVFVRRGDNRSAAVSLFNAGKKKTVTMRTWLLEPGLYKVKEGPDGNDDGVADKVLREREVVFGERVNALDIVVPSGVAWTVCLEQTRSDAGNAFQYPDLALTSHDIVLPGSPVPDQQAEVAVGIHNIGNLKAEDVVVYFLVNGKIADSCKVDRIEAPNDLSVQKKIVTFAWLPQRGENGLAAKVVSRQTEITQWNNYSARTLMVK